MVGAIMNTENAIQKRYACRSFLTEQITEEQRELLIKAAQAAPVAMGDYSTVKLTVVQDQHLRNMIEQETAHGMPMIGEHPTYQAPTLFIISVKENTQFPVIPYCNASCMAENIMIQVAALELASVYIMTVPTVMQKKPELLRTLDIADGFFPAVMVAVGKEKTPNNKKRDNHHLLTHIL